jgi:hypothetical protein
LRAFGYDRQPERKNPNNGPSSFTPCRTLYFNPERGIRDLEMECWKSKPKPSVTRVSVSMFSGAKTQSPSSG